MSEPHRIALNISAGEAIASILERVGVPVRGEYVDDGEPLVVEWGVSDDDLAAAALWMRDVSLNAPPAPPPDPNAFTVDGTVHAAGDADCQECWAGFPEQHRCGGLMHAVFEDESWDPETGDEQVYLTYRCDGCEAGYWD